MSSFEEIRMVGGHCLGPGRSRRCGEVLLYDVVFMDNQMPRMDGLEATPKICAEHAPERRLYIIGLTTQAMASDREECLEIGMDNYVTKPIDLESLAAALQRAHARTLQAAVGNAN